MNREYVKEALEKLLNQDISEMRERLILSINQTECHLSFNPTRFYHLIYSNFNRAANQSIYKPHLAFIMLTWEAIENAEVSRLLSLSCRYSAATGILRQSLEMLLRGGFYDSVAFDVRTDSPDTTRFRREIDNRLANDEELRNSVNDSTVFVLEIVDELENNPPSLIPNLSDITMNLERRRLLEPIPEGSTYNLYRRLCKPVHGAIYSTDIHQRLREGTEGYSPSFVEAALQRFLADFEEFIDTCLVLTFNILRREMTPEQVTEVCTQILADEDIDNDLRGMPYFMTLCNEFT